MAEVQPCYTQGMRQLLGLSRRTTWAECAAGVRRSTDLQANVAAKVSFPVWRTHTLDPKQSVADRI